MDYSRSPRRKPQVVPSPDAPPLPPDPSEPLADLPPRQRDTFEDDSFQPSLSLTQRRRQRKARKAAEAAPAAVPRDQVRQVYVSWRIFSFLIVATLLAVLYLLLTQDAFYVHSIAVGYTSESHFLSPPEIFERTGLANIHLFWIDASEVEHRLEEDAQVASAEVIVGWPPNLVQVTISERQPALIWEQSGLRVWVDVRGRVMAMRQDMPSLVRVIVEKPSKDVHIGRCELQGTDHLLGPGSCIDQDTVNGVLQFKALYPNVTEMLYDPIKGLGFRDGRNWVLWFGNGVDITTKMLVYNAMIADALAKKRQPIEVNVANPDAPYYNFQQER